MAKINLMTKKDFVTKYMKEIENLSFLEISEDLIGYFSNIYDIYQDMIKNNTINEDTIKKLFIDKSNLLTRTTEELLKEKDASSEDIADAIRVNYNAYSWPKVDNPIKTIEDIYKELNNHLNNKKILLAFPDFDAFCELKEKYLPSNETMITILKNINILDFRKINERIIYYYEELPKEKQVQKDDLQVKLRKLEREHNSYLNYKLLIEYETEYQTLSLDLKSIENTSNTLESQKQTKITEKSLKEKELEEAQKKYNNLNHGINKLFSKDKLTALLEEIDKLIKLIKEIEKEIKEINIKLEKCNNNKKSIENAFYLEVFVKITEYPAALEEAKEKIKEYENYDEDSIVKTVEELKSQIAEIEIFLETTQKKDTNGKNIS